MLRSELRRRIERVEQFVRAQDKILCGCICFPEKEPPFFGFDYERELAFRVKCPLHGDRFQVLFHLFVAKWRREREELRRATLSAQFQKAWEVSFPSHLFPGKEEESEDGVYLRLKDGSRVLVQERRFQREGPIGD
jgi:hypothetical protein